MAKERFEAELGLNVNNFLDSLKKGELGLGKFGKELGRLAIAGGAAAGAFSVLAMWFKQTDQGAKVFNTTIKTTRQLLTDLIMGQRSNMNEIIKLYNKESEIKEGDRIDLIKEAALRKQIRGFILGSVDANKSISDRLQEAEKALAKQRELEAYILADKKEELDVITEQLKINQGNTKLMDRHAQLIAEINDTENSESRRLVTQINALREEKLKRQKDLVDAFTFDQFKELRTGLSTITTLEKLLGIAYDENAEKLALYQSTLQSLIADGYDPTSKAIKDIIKNIDMLNNKVNGIKPINTSNALSNFIGRSNNLDQVASIFGVTRESKYSEGGLQKNLNTEAMGQYLDKLEKVTKEYWTQDQAVNALSDSLYEMFKGTEDWGKNMVNSLIEALTRFIAKAIAAMAIQGIINLISNLRQGYGFSFSSAASGDSVLGSIGLASGGLAYGPTLATVGEYSGASSNPEVIAPLNKLMQYMGGNNVHVTVEGRIRGRDLDLVQRRYGVGG